MIPGMQRRRGIDANSMSEDDQIKLAILRSLEDVKTAGPAAPAATDAARPLLDRLMPAADEPLTANNYIDMIGAFFPRVRHVNRAYITEVVAFLSLCARDASGAMTESTDPVDYVNAQKVAGYVARRAAGAGGGAAGAVGVGGARPTESAGGLDSFHVAYTIFMMQMAYETKELMTRHDIDVMVRDKWHTNGMNYDTYRQVRNMVQRALLRPPYVTMNHGHAYAQMYVHANARLGQDVTRHIFRYICVPPPVQHGLTRCFKLYREMVPADVLMMGWLLNLDLPKKMPKRGEMPAKLAELDGVFAQDFVDKLRESRGENGASNSIATMIDALTTEAGTFDAKKMIAFADQSPAYTTLAELRDGLQRWGLI